MDRLVLVLMILAVAASGCIELPGGTEGSGSPEGLEVARIGVSDQSVVTGQTFEVRMDLRNHASEEINLDSVSLFNLGQLEVETGNNIESACGSDTLQPAIEGSPSKMRCSWKVQAPEDLRYGERSMNFDVALEYEGKVTNARNPLQIEFRDEEAVTSSSTETQTVDNGDVSLSLRVQDPARASGEPLDVSLQQSSSGRVLSDYEMSYRPEEVFECRDEVEPVSGRSSQFTCELEHDASQQVTEPLIVTARYKYRQTPELSVQVVEP